MSTATGSTALNSLLSRLKVARTDARPASALAFAWRRFDVAALPSRAVLYGAFSTSMVVSSRAPVLAATTRGPSTATQHTKAHPPASVGWFDDRRLDAIVALTRKASESFGQLAERQVSLRHDPERTPADYAVVTFTVRAPDSMTLLDGEDRLIEFLIEHHAEVEDDFVVVCRRTLRS